MASKSRQYLQFESGLEERLDAGVWLSVAEQETQAALDRVEEPVDDDLVDVVDVRAPDVCVWVRLQQLLVLLPQQARRRMRIEALS